MQTRIVAISHAWGAGGEAIGRAVAGELGFRYVNEDVITLAADTHGVEAAVVAAAERRKGLLRRLVEGWDGLPVLGAVRSGVLSDPHALGRRKDVRAFIVQALHNIAQRGGAVIVAHAASIALAGRKDLLRVLVTASDGTRIERLALGTGGDRIAAAKFMRESDAARADYFWRFYQLKEELPTHYDLVVNTDALAPETAVEIVVATARLRGQEPEGEDARPARTRPRAGRGARKTSKARSRTAASRRR